MAQQETPKQEIYSFGIKVGPVHRDFRVKATSLQDVESKATKLIDYIKGCVMTKVVFVGPITPFIIDVDDFINGSEERQKRGLPY